MHGVLTNRRSGTLDAAAMGGKPTAEHIVRHGHVVRRRETLQRVSNYGLAAFAVLLLVGLYTGRVTVQQREGGSAASAGAAGLAPGQRRMLRDGSLGTDRLVVYIFSNNA